MSATKSIVKAPFQLLGSVFSSPKMPESPPVLPPVKNDEALKDAARLEAERLRKRKGFKSTWLTAGLGDLVEQTQKAELLGG